MKTTKFITTGAVLISAVILGGSIASAAPGDITQNYKSDTIVKFASSEDITNPVDPTNPGEVIEPVDPTDPDKEIEPGTAGPLSLDYASAFYFGENKITSKDEVYYAVAQKLKDGSDRPNYVQVTDNRGTEAGWSLQVKQDGQFMSESNRELVGAMISFTNGQLDTISTSATPSFTKPSFDLTVAGTGVAENIVSAKDGEGAGTFVYRFGTDATKANSVSLSVPGTTTKLAETYATTLTWTLTDVPANEI